LHGGLQTGRNRVSHTAELSCPELQQSLLESATKLQQFIPFQASVQPRIEHLEKGVEALKAQEAQHKAKIEEMEMELQTPHSTAAQMTEEERDMKLRVEKAKYLKLGEQSTTF
jgi:predicted  nucleic acid-binding Zn-ribbon protein